MSRQLQITYCVSCDMPVREANSPARMDDNIKRDVSMVTVNATQAGQTEAALANRKRYPSDASVDDITTKAKLVIQQVRMLPRR